MMRLVLAEAHRLLSRRFTRLALIALLLGLAGFQLVVNDALSPLTGARLAAAQRAYEESHTDWVDSHRNYEQECRDGGGTSEECTFPEPTLAEYRVEPTPFKEVAPTALELSTALVALIAFMIAASFIGAEYSSGSITNWLTFIPRRGHVFWSKLLTLIGFTALLGALSSAITLAAALVLARLYGSHVESLRELAEMGARGVLAVIGLAVLGFCIGLVTRHTAGPIGILLGYGVVWILRMGILGEQAWTQRMTRWTPDGNLAAIVDHGFTYSVPAETVTAEGVNIDYIEHTISLTHGIAYWSILLILVVLGSLLIFHRRDVV